ncbi:MULTISPECIES: adenosylcobinamide-phosphate synthase CbiB [unclassified Thioalkalivibrio]|uniref:adenosylcobinamide-phosphate synthase CbiB n=1 Tax=unclassified Thioalkalivibrio TaxID=2621013 RepID=UPI00037F6A62|nr:MULTISPECIES: adenosylcobinamide-phosphate synthase CbiB [unclassified Thioalkalivibrio]
MLIAFLTLLGALVLDRLIGDPRRWHPLAGFGLLVQRLEARFYRDGRARGALLLAVLVVPFVLLTVWLQQLLPVWLVGLLVLALALGWRSLDEHAERVARALEAGDLGQARQQVQMLVSRDSEALDVAGVSGAAVESVLENGNDALFGTIFWFLVAGAPGVVLYRLVNTLDAMWGYRNARYTRFGWTAARLDDLLNWVPARMTALSYALAGRTRDALQCWGEQAAAWKSPNAGPVMAAGAGALGLVLGGASQYHGERQWRPRLGMGAAPDAAGIRAAMGLVDRALALWMGVLVIGVSLAIF